MLRISRDYKQRHLRVNIDELRSCILQEMKEAAVHAANGQDTNTLLSPGKDLYTLIQTCIDVHTDTVVARETPHSETATLTVVTGGVAAAHGFSQPDENKRFMTADFTRPDAVEIAEMDEDEDQDHEPISTPPSKIQRFSKWVSRMRDKLPWKRAA